MPEVWPVLKGVLTFLPGIYRAGANAAGGSIDPRYCYAVWLRHRVCVRAAGAALPPRLVAELGPGLSLGVGIAALLTGSEEYLAFDVARDANEATNREIAEGIASLLAAGAAVPDDGAYPEVLPRLRAYGSPDATALEWLTPERVEAVQAALVSAVRGGEGQSGGVRIRYVVPWDDAGAIEGGTVDLVIAQAVMEHVEDVASAYASIAAWLRPGGLFSAAIDFRSHGLTTAWNGHWQYSRRIWRLVRGARRWTLNRLGCSDHLRLLREAGLEVLEVQRQFAEVSGAGSALAAEFRHLSEDDRRTAGAYVLARRPS